MKIVNCKLNYSSSRGQVAIIVLLMSAVMLTLGLSMSKKETTEVRINANDEMLKKAFDTAESGINFYLGTGGTNYVSPDQVSFADINATNIGVGSSINFGEFVLAGSNESYWLVNHLANGDIGTTYFAGPNVDVCGVGYSGLIETSYFYKTGVNFNLTRNQFELNSNCGTINIGVGQSPVLISIMPVVNGGKFYVEANNGGTFASQGIDIESEGNAQGQAKKKLNIRQRYKIPGFMVSGMMAEGSILSD